MEYVEVKIEIFLVQQLFRCIVLFSRHKSFDLRPPHVNMSQPAAAAFDSHRYYLQINLQLSAPQFWHRRLYVQQS